MAQILSLVRCTVKYLLRCDSLSLPLDLFASNEGLSSCKIIRSSVYFSVHLVPINSPLAHPEYSRAVHNGKIIVLLTCQEKFTVYLIAFELGIICQRCINYALHVKRHYPSGYLGLQRLPASLSMCQFAGQLRLLVIRT